MSRAAGANAEDRAARFLGKRRYRIIARNVVCGRVGEIDVIARDGDVLVFVEVRSRARSTFGSAAESVDLAKQRKLARAAQHYLSSNPHPGAVRFDVVAIDGDEIELMVDAFRPG